MPIDSFRHGYVLATDRAHRHGYVLAAASATVAAGGGSVTLAAFTGLTCFS